MPEESEIPPPVCRRLLTSDPTEAKLGELLSENPSGLTLELDELAGLFALFDREPSLREFMLKGWSGNGSHTIDRIGRGTVRIPAVCLSVIGGIQPGRIAPLVKAATLGAGGDGLLQRFQLIAWPDSWADEWRLVDRWPDHDAKNKACEIFSTLAHMQPADFPDASDFGPNGLRFTLDAQEQFNEWHTRLHRKLRSAALPETLESSFAKAAKLVAGMALLCELADNPLAVAISANSLTCALKWSAVAESHISRLYGYAQQEETNAARLIWEKIKVGKLTDGFTAREIKRAQWKDLTDSDVIDAALATLAECGWVRAERINAGGNGRPSWRYAINPEAL